MPMDLEWREGNVPHAQEVACALNQQVVMTKGSVLPFSKPNQIFFGYFDPETVSLGDEKKYFSG